MASTAPPRPADRFRFVEPILLAAVFGLAHTQAPVGYSNQNQYLLHGFAVAGVGHLRYDWLAGTADPTPVFTALVAVGYGALGPAFLHGAYFLLVMGYFLAARAVAVAVVPTADTRPARLAFAALFTAAHAAVPRLLSVRLTGTDYPWFLQTGLANQYLLGPGLQPSAFGVLLFAALAVFARGRPVLSGLLTAGAGVVHATYLLPGALLTVGVMAWLVTHGERRRAAAVGVVALVGVLPAVAYSAWAFAPTSAVAFAEAPRILAEFRIPHHAVVGRWLDTVAAVQVVWAVLGLALVRRTPLFTVLVVMAGGGLALTVVQVVTGSDGLALLFPWRVSAVLVPVATTAVLAKLAAAFPASRTTAAVGAVVLTGLAAGGAWAMAAAAGYHTVADEEPLLAWVREHAGPGDVFLVPVRVPSGGGRGVPSTSFTPPPRPTPGSKFIPVDLQRFRLLTGAALYVDFKSVPYRDADVLEWYRRVRQAEAWYADLDWRRPGLREALRQEGITHVVARRGREPTADFLEPVYADDAYAVFQVR